MRYASVCDGIGAVHVAWKPLGWKCAWTSEIEPFPIAVVDHHHGLPNLGDLTKITEEMLDGLPSGAIDLLVGGTPCQSFSVAGLRRGLDDPRGNLALRFVQLAGVLRPRWILWENVPGVLSSAGGRDFGAVLGALAQFGFGFAYRVCDARWYGVAQRRRRVFLVGYLGDWRRAAAVLFERESLCGNPPSRGKAREVTTGALVARSARNGGASNADIDGNQLIAAFGGNNTAGPIDVATSCLAHPSPHCDFKTETFVVSDDPVHAICANEQRTYTNEGSMFQMRNVVGQTVPAPQGFTYSGYSNQPAWMTGDRTDCLPSSGHSDGSHQGMGVLSGLAVRRLTPRECERLQGFPDDYTLIQFRGKPAADGPRYRALGNSMAVPVMRWLGERIALVERLCQQ